jgi:parvulin-like peptidyl-prolyl isomerase
MKPFALLAASAAFLCAQAPLQLPINSEVPADTVVARSDGKPITAGEIRKLLENGDTQSLNMAKRSPEAFLGSVFLTRYLSAEAEKQHLAEQSPLKEQLEYINSRFLAGAMFNRIREEYSVPDQAVDEFYKANASRYEQARIKVIAIGFCPTISQAPGTTDEELAKIAKQLVDASQCKNKHTEEQAHGIASSIVAKLRGGQADFLKMVQQYSEDADSKATEGDFGLVTRDGIFTQEIKDAVFALQADDISNPVRSGNFFYIIKLKEKKVQPLEAVREQIVQALKQKHFTDWLDEINKRFKPVIVRPDFFTGDAAPKPASGPPQLIKPE